MEGIFKDFFERKTVASIVTEYDRDLGSNYVDEQLKKRVKSRGFKQAGKTSSCSQVHVSDLLALEKAPRHKLIRDWSTDDGK